MHSEQARCMHRGSAYVLGQRVVGGSVDDPLLLYALNDTAPLDDPRLEPLILRGHPKQQGDGHTHVQALVHATTSTGREGRAGARGRMR